MYKKNNKQVRQKAQAITLESIFASMLLISVALIFSLQITAITPLSASTSSQHVENQQAELAQGLLETANRTELLQTLLYWNNSSATYYNSDPDGTYRVDPPNTTFGNRTERVLLDKGIGVNIEFRYYENSTVYDPNKFEFFTTGKPSNHASIVQRAVPIYESNVIYNEDGTKSSTTVNESSFFIDNIDKDTELYTIIVIRVTVWRI